MQLPVSDIANYVKNNTQLLQAAGVRQSEQVVIKPLGKGEHNENFVLYEHAEQHEQATIPKRFVLRINRVPQPFHKNQVAYEYAALQTLKQSGCTPVPLYCDYSSDAPGNGVLLESFCAGTQLNFDNLHADDLQNVARIMAQVHAVPVTKQATQTLFCPRDPLLALFDECVDRFSAYHGTALEDARFTRWVERFFSETHKKIDACPPPSEHRHVINTETLPSHFLLRSTLDDDCVTHVSPSGQVRGFFVDWERPILGEVAQDLAFFVAPSTTFWDSNYLFPREHIQSFLDEYWRAVDGRFSKENFEARFDAYVAVSVLRSQTWFCKNAARYSTSSAASSTQHTVARTFEKWDIYTSDEFNEMLLRECF